MVAVNVLLVKCQVVRLAPNIGSGIVVVGDRDVQAEFPPKDGVVDDVGSSDAAECWIRRVEHGTRIPILHKKSHSLNVATGSDLIGSRNGSGGTPRKV